MHKYHNSFLGPSAPWMDGEDDLDLVSYTEMVKGSAASLAESLEFRARSLRNEDVCLDEVLGEIRRQATEAGASGHLGLMRELAELAMELLMAKESARRAV